VHRDEPIQLATETWPEYKQLSEYQSLRLRQAIDANATPYYVQPLILSVVADKRHSRLR
jgi:hypothetical protein